MNAEHYNELIELSQKIYDGATEKLTNYLSARYCAIGNDTVYAVSGMGKLHRWSYHAEKWTHDVVADFQTDCRLGCHLFGHDLLVPDESGGILLYQEAKP